MVTYTTPDRSWDAGVPSQSRDEFAPRQEGLIVGEYPHQFTQDIPVALNQDLAAYTVVALDASGHVVAAAPGEPAIGILLYPVKTGASGDLPGGRVLRSGCINPDRVFWPAGYDTIEKKMVAFEGAPSPTQFVLRRLAHATPIRP